MKKILSRILTLVLSLVLVFVFVDSVHAASLWLSPTSGTYGKNATVKVNVGVDTAGEAINAVQANVTYPADKLQFLSVSTSGSALTIFAEKTGGGGMVRIAGGIPSPGITGSKFIATCYFKVLTDSGTATLTFAGDSSVLKNADNGEALSTKGISTLTLSGTSSSTGGSNQSGQTPTETQGSALAISDVVVSNIDKRTATVTWVTSANADSSVSYGTGTDLAFTATSDELVTKHALSLDTSLLVPGTSYYYKVKSTDASGESVESEVMEFMTRGYTVSVTVLSVDGNPVLGAEVELYSDPRKSVTDENGVVTFTDVSPGKHGLIAKHEGKTIIQDIEVTEDDAPQSFQASFAQESSQQSLVSRFAYGIVGIVLFVIVAALLIATVIKIRKKRLQPEPSVNTVITDDASITPPMGDVGTSTPTSPEDNENPPIN